MLSTGFRYDLNKHDTFQFYTFFKLDVYSNLLKYLCNKDEMPHHEAYDRNTYRVDASHNLENNLPRLTISQQLLC